MIDFDDVDVISFDCYGTLVDWESGILEALRPLLHRRRLQIEDDRVLELYGRFESAAEEGEFVPYRTVLQRVVHAFAAEFSMTLGPGESDRLADSLERWPPFPDTRSALRRLRKHFRLVIISNIDEDLFARTEPALGVEFDWVVTAERVGSYKPSPRNFEVAMEVAAVKAEHWLHAAQSLFHDIVPARELGLATVWVNRRHGRAGFGATPPAAAVPDLEVESLDELASRIEAARR
jgi:2-haloacid dehalogenase